MLHVHQSNRLEVLARRLADQMGVTAGDPFTRETVIVPNAGVGRWLALQVAERLGVCANVAFVLPGAFVWDLFRGVLDGVPQTSAFAPPVLVWRLYAELPRLAREPLFREIGRYLAGADPAMRFALAQRLASTFDQYLVYRPDWIARWEAGGDDADWQAQLWRRLVADGPHTHWVRLQGAFATALQDHAASTRMPARVALFGMPTLSPAYLDVLARLAAVADVHLFLLNPCREYWGDIVAARDLARRDVIDEQAGHYTVGNPLLASLGKQGREFFDAVAELPASVHEVFEQVRGRTLLSCVQSDILDLRDRGAGPPTAHDPADRSITVHACHGPMREVEVLHDSLLGWFESLPGLTPADVVVMAPDIETYAPCVEAVFGAATGARHIPFAIADRPHPGHGGLTAVWFGLLDVAAGRMHADRVLDLLDCTALARRFGLTAGDLERIRAWVRESGIRWGRDGAHRALLGLPSSPAHTWRAGLDRLLLGYALPGDGQTLFAGVAPYPEIEGSAAAALGGLAEFLAALGELAQCLQSQRPVAGWAAQLRRFLDRFFDPDPADEREAAALRDALAALDEHAAVAACAEAVPIEVVRAALDEPLGGHRSGRFPNGAVSICAMVPMRSIPFRVVCLLGMDADAVPRRQPRLGFDRMAAAMRRGDRSRREDDRYLFLEALLSARDALHLSYVGQDMRDNSLRLPSVLVLELLEYLGRSFDFGAADAAATLVMHHPLQPFSPRCFGADPQLFSYAEELAAAVRARSRGPGRRSVPLVTTPVPAARIDTVVLEDMVQLYRNPARGFLQQRLGLRPFASSPMVAQDEPFTVDGLARWGLESRLLALARAGCAPHQARPLLEAEGLLPHGAVGEVVHAELARGVQDLLRRCEFERLGAPLAPLPVSLELDGLHLQGELGELYPGGRMEAAPAHIDARAWLGLWLRHLVLNALEPDGIEPVSRFVARTQTLTLAALDAGLARRCLTQLAHGYLQGLQRPLPLFARSSLEYAVQLRAGDPDPLQAARACWFSNPYKRGDDADPWVRYAWRDAVPLDGEFERLARTVLAPALERGTIDG